MSRRWPTQTINAVREAVAAGARYSEICTKLKAGTLPGLDGPQPVPERTVAGWISQARREQGAGRCPTCGQPVRNGKSAKPPGPPNLEGSPLLKRIAADLERERRREA